MVRVMLNSGIILSYPSATDWNWSQNPGEPVTVNGADKKLVATFSPGSITAVDAGDGSIAGTPPGYAYPPNSNGSHATRHGVPHPMDGVAAPTGA